MPPLTSFSRRSTTASPGPSEFKDRGPSLRFKITEARAVRLQSLAALAFFILHAGVLSAQQQGMPRLDFAVELAPLLKEYCFGCHNSKRKKGDIDIESALRSRPLVSRKDLWVNVLARVRDGDMPPEDEEQPSSSERSRLLRWLDDSINHFDYGKVRDPGYEPARRLTNREYNNTVGELFGIKGSFSGGFPEDLSGRSGFDNSANTLFTTTLLLERYIGAADLVLRTALPGQARSEAEKKRRETVFVSRPGAGVSQEKAARKIFENFLPRAYRRDLGAGEIEEALARFRRFHSGDRDFEAAIREVLRVVLISPKFLMKTEKKRAGDKEYQVDHWALASRLSYFLWASMPDAELFTLARQGKLSDPAVLDGQVARMLADPRAATLGYIFAAQWLGYEILGTRIRLDPIDNPWCTDTLMASMKQETSMFFNELIRENRQVTELIDADFTYLNEELARHYGIRGVKGSRMRRVELDNSVRGGILGQGSILACTSFPGRTSPVVRGNWILSEILGTPPPPPPPDAGELDEKISENRRLDARQKLELHSRKASCKACHSLMDPLGFGLENFDWFGRWRENNRGRRIDARGSLPDGTEFEGVKGLKKALVERRRDELASQLIRKFLSYALGRQLEYYDEGVVREIAAKVARGDLRFNSLIGEVVRSYPFLYKKNRSARK